MARGLSNLGATAHSATLHGASATTVDAVRAYCVACVWARAILPTPATLQLFDLSFRQPCLAAAISIAGIRTYQMHKI